MFFIMLFKWEILVTCVAPCRDSGVFQWQKGLLKGFNGLGIIRGCAEFVLFDLRFFGPNQIDFDKTS